MRAKGLLLAIGLMLATSGAQAQNCSGQPLAGLVCGNPNASQGLPSWATQTALIDRAFGSTQGTVLNRGASVWAAVATPSLGRNGGTGGAVTLNGATSGSATIGVKAVAGTSIVFNLPTTNGSLNNVLITDGAGNTSWVSAGGGTVSSVGLALPGIFTVTNSPVTSTGTLTATLNTQTANTVWSGPASGAAATPTFRSLVGADLPNPSSSSLGGVQSAAAVVHQWVNSISTSGVPVLSQPAFADISGSITPAQCPNPTASTTGCIQSYAAVASQWINAISTGGVPSSSQPTFSDVAGQASLPQLPSIGGTTILSNITGGTATPAANSLTSIIDAIIGSAQGSIIYRSGTVWTALSPGTSGQVLTTSGPAANPSWTAVTGTGTVTSVATNAGLTGGPITTSGTIGLAPISTGNVLANVSGGSAAPSATTPTQVLDVIGSTQGNILYRSGTVWSALAPGTSGQVLMTPGAGSTPSWANTVSSIVVGVGLAGGTITTTGTVTLATAPPGGRLTNSSGSCVPTTDVAAATSMFYAPCNSPFIPIYNGTAVQVYNFTSSATDTVGLTLALGSNWAASTLFDGFVTLNSGSPVLCTVPWTTSTAGSSARATALALYTGVQTNATTATCRISNAATISMAANQGTYIGTFLTNGSTGQVDLKFGTAAAGGGAACMCVWNMYNRTQSAITIIDTTTSWNATVSSTIQPMDAGSTGSGLNNRVTVVSGLGTDPISATIGLVIATAASNNGQIGFALNSTSTFYTRCPIISVGGGVALQQSGGISCQVYPTVGNNFLQAVQWANNTNSNTVFATGSPTAEAFGGLIQW